MHQIIKPFLLILSIGLGWLSGSAPIDKLLTQDNHFPETLYLVTRNESTEISTIWRVDGSTSTSAPVFSLDFYTQSVPNDMLSVHEKLAVQKAVSQGIITKGSSMTAGMSQYIEAVWQLDSDHLLLETSTEFCEPISHRICFGYYELSKLSLMNNPPVSQSLLRLDYHHPVLNEWLGCSSIGNKILIDNISINPVVDKMAFTIKAVKNCYAGGKSETVIYDFSKSEVNRIEIPLADGISWSPDGTRLAYFVRETCPLTTPFCHTSIEIYSVLDNTTTVVKTSNELPFQIPAITNWKDNHTLIYQWTTLSVDGYDPLIIQHSLDTGNEIETAIGSTYLTNYYRLGEDSAILIGYQGMGEWGKIFSVDNFMPIISFDQIDTLFYNSRYPTFIVLQQSKSKQMMILDMYSQLTPITLYPEIAASETVIYVTPAKA